MGPGGGSAAFGFESGPVGGICRQEKPVRWSGAEWTWGTLLEDAGEDRAFDGVRLCPPGCEADLPTPDATSQAWGWRGQPWTHAGEPLSARELGSRARVSLAGWGAARRGTRSLSASLVSTST